MERSVVVMSATGSRRTSNNSGDASRTHTRCSGEDAGVERTKEGARRRKRGDTLRALMLSAEEWRDNQNGLCWTMVSRVLCLRRGVKYEDRADVIALGPGASKGKAGGGRDDDAAWKQ